VSVRDLRPVDRLEIAVIVDNATDGLSTTPKHVVSEWASLQAAGRLSVISGEAICHAHHGLSLLITAQRGDERRTVLMDAGPEGATFLRNSQILGVDFARIDAVVLSHGHWDHGGGLPAAVGAIADRRQAPVECFLHPGMFAQRASRRPDGAMYLHEMLASPEGLTAAGARPVVTRDAAVVAEGMFWVSGEVPRVTAFEVGLPGHVRRSGEGWEPDPLIMDERFVAVHVRNRGVMVFSSCSHAGIVNVLTRAVEQVDAPLYGVMGGFHLSGSTESIIPDTLAGLQRFRPNVLAPGHCTGWRAITSMARMFGDELVPSSVGKRYLL
jgi:7,8-dihydropterin-6-yl-methyl-4-(beta-D-ribofuranosyl)aminobenzene 5'-phosphate synthase